MGETSGFYYEIQEMTFSFLSVSINCANTGSLWEEKWAIVGGKCSCFLFVFSWCLSTSQICKEGYWAEGMGADVHFFAQEVGVHMAGTVLSTLCKP